MQCPSSKVVEGGAMGARGGDLEVLLRPDLETGIAQSKILFFPEDFANSVFRCGNLNFSSRTKCNGTLPNGDVSKMKQMYGPFYHISGLPSCAARV